MVTMVALALVNLLWVVTSYPNNGPYPASFDCPMRDLAVSFAQNIQPFLTTQQVNGQASALLLKWQ